MSNKNNGWNVYLVRCADGSLYAGIAKDLSARIETHNRGKGAKYTKARMPVELVWSQSCKDRSIASKIEAHIKSLSRAQKLALIGGVL